MLREGSKSETFPSLSHLQCSDVGKRAVYPPREIDPPSQSERLSARQMSSVEQRWPIQGCAYTQLPVLEKSLPSSPQEPNAHVHILCSSLCCGLFRCRPGAALWFTPWRNWNVKSATTATILTVGNPNFWAVCIESVPNV